MRLVHHTWQWLASRLPVRAIWNDEHGAPARPCLPAAEPLGDRVMLDGTVLIEQQIKGESDTQILIGLIKGELDLAKMQLQTLELASKVEIKGELLHKFASEWLDVNDVLSKFGEALIKGELSDKKFDKIAHKLDAELNDVDQLAAKIETQGVGLLLPAVQKVREAAVDMFLKLGDIKLGEELKWQDEKVLIKVSDAFSKMDDLLLKFAVDVLTGGFIKGELEEALVKFEGLSNKASDYLLKLDDPELHKLLLPAVQQLSLGYESLLNSLAPNSNPQFEGGVSVVEETDDLISEA